MNGFDGQPIAALFEKLSALGVVLTHENGRLRCSAPKGVLTPDLHEEIGRRRDELILFIDSRLLTSAADDQPTPLAVAQERIWFLHQLDPSSSAYTVGFKTRLKGAALSREAFEGAWSDLIARHESLRCRFTIVDGRPMLRVTPPFTAPVSFVDLRHLPASQQKDDTERLTADEEQRPFDLEQGPVFRITLVAITDTDHLMLFAAHHIVCDQWSLGILVADFAQKYMARLGGRSPAVDETVVGYRKLAIAQRTWLDGADGRRQIEYWREQLKGFEPAELHTDRPRVGSHRGQEAEIVWRIPPELAASLRILASSERVTLFMVLLAVFAVVLSRHVGEEDIAIGSPIANRNMPGMGDVVGMFVNTLVFRLRLAGLGSFRDLLSHVREVALGAYANQDLPFDRLVSELRPARDSNRSPFFQVIFGGQSTPAKTGSVPGLHAEFESFRRQAPFDLAVAVDTGVAPFLIYRYDSELFEAETIERWVTHYRNVLESAVRDPGFDLGSVELMSAEEQTTVLETWNATATDLDVDQTVIDLFVQQALATPDAPAVIWRAGLMSYRELHRRSDEVAAVLVRHGLTAGAVVAVCLPRSADLVAISLGVLKARAAYVLLDPAYPTERLGFMIRDSAAALVVTERGLAERLRGSDGAVICSEDIVEEALAAPPAASGGPQADDLAYVLYTSGSTGEPKGVEVTHRSLTNVLQSTRRMPGLSPDDRMLAVSSPSFDISGVELFCPLISGAAVVIASSEDAADPARLAALMRNQRITMLFATPATWRMLIDSGWTGDQNLTILCGGDVLSRDLAEELLRKSKALWNIYGPTETTIYSATERVTAGRGPVSIGRPIANTQIYLLDAKRRLAPIGVAGEIFIGGAGVARGYRGRSELTQARFVPDTVRGLPGRLYRTGDLARARNNGRLDFLGRSDRQVKIRGFRIELGEVESILALHPAIRQSVVLARPDTQGTATLVAYFVRRRGVDAALDGSGADQAPRAKPIIADIRRFLKDRLPAHMVPARFVEVDTIPLTPNGKVDVSLLQEASSSSDDVGLDVSGSPVELALQQIWQELLGVPSVGLDDDFFAVGGHSLLAVGLVTAIERRFSRKLPLVAIIEAPTVRQMAVVVEHGWRPSPWVSLVPLQTRGTKPPFFCVHSVGGSVMRYAALAARLAPDQPIIGIRASGHDGVGESIESIQGQAAFYIREILEYQPIGPYYIGGYSHGGRVALEMALQLEALGKQVAFLGIFDTTPYTYIDLSPIAFWRWLRNVPLWFWYDARREQWPQHRDRFRRLARRIRGRFHHETSSAAVPGSRLEVHHLMNLDTLPPDMQATFENDFKAFMEYKPAARCGPVTLFRAAGRPIFDAQEPDLGWGRVSRGTVTVRSIKGNHSSILSEPDVEGLARAVREELDSAIAKSNAGNAHDLHVDLRSSCAFGDGG